MAKSRRWPLWEKNDANPPGPLDEILAPESRVKRWT